MLPIIVKAVDEMFHQPKNIFWTGRAMDMLFDGVPIDCSSDEFEAKAACSIFEAGEVAAIKPHNDTHFSFSLFAGVSGLLNIKGNLITKAVISINSYFFRQTALILDSSQCFEAKRLVE